MSDGIDSARDNNPYAAPSWPAGQAPPAGDANSPDAELRACIGRNADYYLRNWHGVLKGRHQSTGFNWAGFLLGPLWLPYRKMYVATLILYAVVIAESVLEIVLETWIGTPPPVWLDRLIPLGIGLVCGGFGNRWYLSHVAKVIAKTRAEGLQSGEFLSRIALRGGTNIFASLLLFALFMAATIAIFTGIEFLSDADDPNAEELLLPDE